MHYFRVVILCILNQEYHQERDDGCAGVDNKLPGIGKTKHRPRHRPNDNDQKGDDKRPRTTQRIRAFSGNNMKDVLYATEEIVLTRLCFVILDAICDSNVSSRLRNNLRAWKRCIWS